MAKQIGISLKLQPKSKKTRSEPADTDDPYKMDLLEEELTIKYEQMIKDQGKQMNLEA